MGRRPLSPPFELCFQKSKKIDLEVKGIRNTDFLNNVVPADHLHEKQNGRGDKPWTIKKPNVTQQDYNLLQL